MSWDIALVITLGLATVIGGVAGVTQLWDRYQRQRGHITWKTVERGVVKLIKLIREDNFQPDVIVGLGRGGSIIGALLSGNLGVIPFTAIDRRYHWESKKRSVSILDFGPITLENKRVLLATAEPYTGETLRAAVEYLQSRKPTETKVASLCKCEITTMVPHYYAFEIKSVEHVPWRILPAYVRDSKAPSERF